jgi:hypothetical protein
MNRKMLSVYKISVLLLILSISNIVYAQKKELNPNNIPSTVMNAIKTDFPTWNIDKTKWYAYDASTLDWAPIEGEFSSYIVQARGNNYTVMAVYDETGKLRYSKAILKNIVLPTSITEKLATDDAYQGWRVTGDQEIIRNFKEDRKTYKVTLAKDGKKKSVYFDRMGKEMKKPFLGEM